MQRFSLQIWLNFGSSLFKWHLNWQFYYFSIINKKEICYGIIIDQWLCLPFLLETVINCRFDRCTWIYVCYYYCSLQSELHGRAALKWAICLDSLQRYALSLSLSPKSLQWLPSCSLSYTHIPTHDTQIWVTKNDEWSYGTMRSAFWSVLWIHIFHFQSLDSLSELFVMISIWKCILRPTFTFFRKKFTIF